MKTKQTLLVLGAMLITLTACDRLLPKGSNSSSQDANTPNVESPQSRPAATQVAPWYEDLTPAQAFKQAADEDKTVFIEFYRKTCSAGEELERTVLQDKRVRAFLTEHAVPIRVDVDFNRLLGRQYRVVGTPTLLFLRPDGSEIDSLVGLLDRDSFLAYAASFIAGRTQITMALEEVAYAHYQLASMLARKNKIQEALAEYEWILDYCLDFPELFDNSAPFVIRDLVEMAEQFTGAKEALKQHYKTAYQRLKSGSGRTIDMKMVGTIDRWRDKQANTVALYDQIRGQCSDPDLLAEWTEVVFDALLAARRYDDLAAGMDLEQAVERLFQWTEKERPRRADYEKAGEHRRATTAHNQQLCYAACAYYQVLIALQREAAANTLAKRLLDVAGGCQTLNGLAWAGYLSGRPTETNLRQAREADECARKNSAAIIDTLARVLDARGQRDEAVQLLEERIKRTNNDSDRNLLRTCLSEIEAQP